MHSLQTSINYNPTQAIYNTHLLLQALASGKPATCVQPPLHLSLHINFSIMLWDAGSLIPSPELTSYIIHYIITMTNKPYQRAKYAYQNYTTSDTHYLSAFTHIQLDHLIADVTFATNLATADYNFEAFLQVLREVREQRKQQERAANKRWDRKLNFIRAHSEVKTKGYSLIALVSTVLSIIANWVVEGSSRSVSWGMWTGIAFNLLIIAAIIYLTTIIYMLYSPTQPDKGTSLAEVEKELSHSKQ